MDVIRLTVIDSAGTTSFIAHSSAALALTAACAENPTTLDDLLTASQRYDRGLRAMVMRGLSIFDEHNLPDQLDAIHRQIAELPPRDVPPFRVYDSITLEASLRPVRAGVILFNLPAHRIVQIENTYEPLSRTGEINFHNGKFLSIRLLPYELPHTWSIVP